MAKSRTIFVCDACGYQSPKWSGRCPQCDAWNTLEEMRQTPSRGRHSGTDAPQHPPVPLTAIPADDDQTRIPSGIGELDRVLGGGLFPGSVILLAGQPGIGKSTLTLQLLLKLRSAGRTALYVSGEESLQQLRHRAGRLFLPLNDLLMLAETNLADIEAHIGQIGPSVVAVDSIQAVYHPDLGGAPGNVGQVRECAARLFQLAKTTGFTLVLVGHVTKDGAVAGPKILEHLVDVVVTFEANSQEHRLIRAVKNRFGAANELGVFEMRSDGLREVSHPAELFLSRRQEAAVGNCVVCSYEGSRPLLIEVQALVSKASYGTPQRTVTGFSHRRLSLILAVLERYCGMNFGYHDVFVKLAGGLEVDDPGIDLGVAAALHSSLLDDAVPQDAIYLGELGLGGEVRPVSFADRRVAEAAKLGFSQVFLAAANLPEPKARQAKVLYAPLGRIAELLGGARPARSDADRHGKDPS